MAYKLNLVISTFETVAYWIRTCEKYLNGRLLANSSQEVEISSGDTLRLVIKTCNVRVYYSRKGEDGVELSGSKTLPLDNYRFYSTAKAVIPGESYSYDVTYTFKHPLEGTKPVYKRVNDGWRKQTAYERVDDTWVRISTTDTISFTIDGETWYAREGMTWSEWCNANDYSLNSWHIFGTKVAPLDNSKYIVGVTGNIDGDDKIIAGSNYITKQPATDGSYDISVAFSGAYLSVTPYSTNPTSISSGETVTLKYDWTSNGATPDAVNVSNCEYSKSYTGTKSGVLTITLSNPSDDVVVNVRFEK